MIYRGIDRWNSQDSLQHYGVIGMKWGMRKAEARGEQYNYRSIGQRLKQRKVNKLSSKLKSTINAQKKVKLTNKLAKQTNKLNVLKTRDKNRQQYAKSTSTGAAVARGILLGGFGAGNYNRARAAGGSILTSSMAGVIGSLSGPLGMAAIPVTKIAEFYNARPKKNKSR